jgi:hypothetical protein
MCFGVQPTLITLKQSFQSKTILTTIQVNKKHAVIGFSVIVVLLFFFKKPQVMRTNRPISENSNESSYITHAGKPNALQKLPKSQKPLGFDPQSSDSMDKYWDDRYETNVTTVTNIVKSGTNSTRVQITSVRKNKHFGTDDWELFSKIKFQNDCALEPDQIQILDILREYPPARDSSRLFTGAYGVKFLLYNIRNEVNRSINAEIRLENRVETRLDEVNAFTEARIQRDYERHQEECLRSWQSINAEKEQYWAALKALYGDFPKDLFQRLMAVEYQQIF